MTAGARLRAIEKQLAARPGGGDCICPPDRRYVRIIWPAEDADRHPTADPERCPRYGGAPEAIIEIVHPDPSIDQAEY